MILFLPLALTLFSATGVTHSPAAPAQIQVPLIFVPGFKGSRLVDKNGHTAWVNGLNALGYNPESLQLPLMWHPQARSNKATSDNGTADDSADGDDENSGAPSVPGNIFSQLNFDKLKARLKGVPPAYVSPLIYRQARDGLLPDGPVANISVIPWLLDEEVYGPFLKEISKWGRPYYTFSYDWRRDNNESAAKLRQFILKIKKERGVDRVDVVGHSMGGLLVFSLMNEDAHFFRKVVFAGTPFHGGVGFMPDMHVGTSTGLNKKILSPEVLFSFPSVYTLFPDQAIDQKPGQQPTNAIDASADALDANGNPLIIDYFKVSDWRDFKLGLFGRRKVSVSEEDFLSHALAQAKVFRQKLNLRNGEYPRSMVILGHKFKTLSYMIHGGPKSVFGWDFESHPQVPGDGRVGANNLPPEYVPYDLFYSEAEHGKLLNDPKMIAHIKSYLGVMPQTAR